MQGSNGSNGSNACPIEGLAPQFTAAVKELDSVADQRNSTLAKWAAAKTALAADGHQGWLRVEYERLTALVRELDDRLAKAQAEVRRIDSEMATAYQEWCWRARSTPIKPPNSFPTVR